MDLRELEYTNFALKSLIDKRPIEIFVFHNALNGISNFLSSDMKDFERDFINENMDVFLGIINIFKRYLKNESCVREIIQVNYTDFNKLVDQLFKGLPQ